MNSIDAKTGNNFPVFNFGSDLMNLKILIVLTMVLCAFCVLPVNASYTDLIISKTPVENNLGFNPTESSLSVRTYQVLQTVNGLPLDECRIYLYKDNQPYMNYTEIWLSNIPSDNYNNKMTVIQSVNLPALISIGGTGSYSIVLKCGYDVEPNTPPWEFDLALWNFNIGELPPNEFDIDIDLQEQTLELGEINSLEQTFYIGSSSNRVVRSYFTYSATSCDIEDLQRNYVKVKFNKNFLDDSEIYLSGYALNQTAESEFTTYVRFNFTYIPVSNLQAFIQTYDYQTGNMVSGVNMSVYEVIDHDTYAELGQLVYSSTSANSQTVLQLKNDTDYFVINNLDGYYAVKNTVYPYFNGLEGYWWSLPYYQNPLLLYYSKLDTSAQYNANFIVHDTNQNGISGVSVTMDNSKTLITNNIGGVSFENVSAGQHTFVFVKNGYQTAQRTINIQMQYASFDQVLYKDNQIIQPTVQPTAYPTIQPTVQPTISPIDKPSNLAESVKYGLAKVFGVNSLNTINLIFALMIILFPAVVAGVITNQALAFVAGGLIGFVFTLALGLIPIWIFFAMVMLTVIYLVLTHGNEGF